jgi:hypothetical protein
MQKHDSMRRMAHERHRQHRPRQAYRRTHNTRSLGRAEPDGAHVEKLLLNDIKLVRCETPVRACRFGSNWDEQAPLEAFK